MQLSLLGMILFSNLSNNYDNIEINDTVITNIKLTYSIDPKINDFKIYIQTDNNNIFTKSDAILNDNLNLFTGKCMINNLCYITQDIVINSIPPELSDTVLNDNKDKIKELMYGLYNYLLICMENKFDVEQNINIAPERGYMTCYIKLKKVIEELKTQNIEIIAVNKL